MIRSDPAIAQPLQQALASERLRIVAGLIRTTGDWELAEDCVQDAAERALARWPRDGVPDNPAAWLTTTAHRRALDVLRRRRTESDKLRELTAMIDHAGLAAPPPGVPNGSDPYPQLYRDDRLRLIFTCCHPALPPAGRIALTLKTVSGLSTRQIAAAFLVSEATMGQRLLRTRGKIAHAGISFRVPGPGRLEERLAGVLAVVYLVFNEGYSRLDEAGDELAAEAIRLAGLLTEVLPADAEVSALHALLLFQHARRDARTDAAGDLVPLPEQDRGQWDRAMLMAGRDALAAARAAGGPVGCYRLQAEIAAVHATSAGGPATDWGRIVAGYQALHQLQPTPVVALNRAVAFGFRDGPAAGLDALAAVEADGRLAGYHLLPGVRADLLRRAGLPVEAGAAYLQAIELAPTDRERRFYERRLGDLGGLGGPSVGRAAEL